MWLRLLQNLLFGNYFYGFCAVALSIESALIRQQRLNNFAFYIILFCGSTCYYTFAYQKSKQSGTNNKRANWYYINQKSIRFSQQVLCTILAAAVLLYGFNFFYAFYKLPLQAWVIICLFPLLAFLYYGYFFPGFSQLNIRQFGWVKPFVIGFIWSGLVTIYPIIAVKAEQNVYTTLNKYDLMLFLKNWMFVTVLCIMFDIKDFAADHNHQLKTFVVRYGLRKTIFYIIIPLVFAGFLSFMFFAWFNHFSTIKIILNTIPFCLLLYVAYSLHQRKSIQYYLAVIDGQMLVKAICGIIAVKFF